MDTEFKTVIDDTLQDGFFTWRWKPNPDHIESRKLTDRDEDWLKFFGYDQSGYTYSANSDTMGRLIFLVENRYSKSQQ